MIQVMRPRRSESGPVDPSRLAPDDTEQYSAAQLYWLGYIAAAGRLYSQGPGPTLVLDVDPRDVEHVRQMVEDLGPGRLSCELCRSNQNGLQAYFRDREFGKFLVQWGIPSTSADGSVPVAFIPGSLLPHFVRGYLEGGHHTPPFGGRMTPSMLASVRRVGLIGPEVFLSRLSTALRRHAGVRAGTMTRRRDGRRLLTYRSHHARRLIEYAYRHPSPSLPRAAKLLRSVQSRAGLKGTRKSRPR